MDPTDLTTTVAHAVDLSDEIDALETKLKRKRAELDPLEKFIITAAEKIAVETDGTRRAQIGVVKLVWPKASLKLTESNFAAARELAGKSWVKIAEKVAVPFKLVKAARDIIPALFGKDGPKILKLLESEPPSPRITYS